MTSRNWIWAALLAVVLLLAGMSIGVMVDRLFLLPQPLAARLGVWPAGPPSPRGSPNSAEVLEARLGLTSDQRQKVDAILQEWEGKSRALQDDLRMQFLRSQDELRQEIEAVLTPEQVEKFRALPWVAPRGRAVGPGGRMAGPGRRGRE